VAVLTKAERLALLSQAPAPLLVGVLALRDGMCRWPVGEPKQPGFGFCGHSQVPGMSYCGHHARVAYQPAVRSGK
jgi:GcrA cell cycle regulator